jgi:POT family proton-dependent oligopeptide transporter
MEEEEEEDLPVSVAHSKKLEDVFQDEGLLERQDAASIRKAKRKQERIREFFNSFYFSINVGALGSFALIPLVRANFGFGASFLIPTISMILALGIFRSHKNEYKHRKRDESEYTLLEVLQVSFQILLGRFLQTTLGRMLGATLGRNFHTNIHARIPRDERASDDEDGSIHSHSSNDNDNEVYHDASQALHILPLMAFFPIFWMLYDQQGSVWTLQATRMNLHGFEPEQLQFLNPLEIMIFIPLFDVKIYPWLERRGFNIQPLRRMEYGMLLTAVSFAMSTLLEQQIESQATMSVSMIWQIPQITVLTVAEILLNVTGLEFAYSQAPANMQAMILALYLFMTAIGDGLAALLYGSVFAYLSAATAMIICAVCMIINMIFFAMVARRWTPYNHEPETTEGLELGPVHNIEHQH